MKTYLPELTISDLMQAIASQDWSSVEKKLGTQRYERLGLDRALAIASDLSTRHKTLHGLRVLDVGCNNGLMAKTLSTLGCFVVGIDNSDVDGQGLYSDLQSTMQFSGFEYHNKDLAEFLNEDTRCWDYILLLSVSHHWETGYAMSGKRRYSDEDIRHVLSTLIQQTRLSIYYECPSNEPGFEAGFGVDFLFRHCREIPKMRWLGRTIGPNGYLRQFWALDKE
jgi:SAM-dependent methyltransferase